MGRTFRKGSDNGVSFKKEYKAAAKKKEAERKAKAAENAEPPVDKRPPETPKVKFGKPQVSSGNGKPSSPKPAGKQDKFIPKTVLLNPHDVDASVCHERVIPEPPIERAVVKFFDKNPDKLFGFATTEFPNKSGSPELFFHMGSGCSMMLAQDPNGSQIAMTMESGLPFPVEGDKIVFMRGEGIKGEKIMRWAYLEEATDAVKRFMSLPDYRLVEYRTGIGGKGKTTKVLWAGDNLFDLSAKFPPYRRLELGLSSTSEGTVNRVFEVHDKAAKTWTKCDDPRKMAESALKRA